MRYVKKVLIFILKFIRFLIKSAWNLCISVVGSISWILKIGLEITTISLLCGCVIGCFVFFKIKPELDECMEIAYDKIANANEEDFMKAMDTYVYDKDGNTIGIINAGNFVYVDINDISMNIQNMYISQEDKRFKEHTGVDWISTIRAMLALVKNGGEITQGGSTITQQVIKNTYLTQEKSFKRKIIEIMMAPQIELKFSKPKIMEYYCNTNFYGNRCYGVEAASNYYFGKKASEVSIAEAAMLVGLSNNPSAYDPVKNYDEALKKRNSVIENYCENGYITEDERDQALAEELTIAQQGSGEYYETYQSAYAIHCAALELMKQDNFPFQYTFKDKDEYDAYMEKYDTEYADKTNEIRGGGYKIYTSLDSTMQAQLQESIDSALAGFDEVQENGKFAMQGAAVIADNNTGYIVAIVGGRGTDDQYNRAYLSARQPGSSIKPLIDYVPAFDTGMFYPSKILIDQPIEDGPENSGGGYRGAITLREAANRSINTIAWQVLQSIGVNNGLAYLGRMHFMKISYIDNDVNALSIGGFTNGTRVVDMAKGYQTLANDGEYNDRTCIVRIVDSNDNTIIKEREPEKEQIYEKDSAYMMTDVLKGTLNQPFGTGYGLALSSGMPAAGKTGTTNSNKDTWFCGYTKYYTTAVWVGYDIPREMPGIFGATYAGAIWKNIMDKIHDGLELQDWDRPETVYDSYYNPSTGEPTSNETGVADIFSRLAEIRAEEAERQKKEMDFIAGIEKQVEQYEATTIAGPTDTYKIEEDFKNINNVLAEIDNQEERDRLYNRIYDKYKQLCGIRDSMSEEIEMYERQQAAAESAAAVEAESKAEEERLRFLAETRENEAVLAIEKVEQMEYQPEDDSLVMEAWEAVELLEDNESYLYYSERLDTAIRRMHNLPSYEEYMEQKAIEESEAEERESAEAAEREEMRHRIEDSLNGVETQAWDAYTNGPGSYDPNYGPSSMTGPVSGPGRAPVEGPSASN